MDDYQLSNGCDWFGANSKNCAMGNQLFLKMFFNITNVNLLPLQSVMISKELVHTKLYQLLYFTFHIQ